MSIAVVDSGGANIASVLHALHRLGAEPVFTRDADTIRAAERVILPGVGAAASAMETLRNNNLANTLRALKQPVLGVCLGMQLLFESTEEGDVELLNLIPARVTKLPDGPGLRVPHMGWNHLRSTTNDSLGGSINGLWFYFVHSYAAPIGAWTIASSTHGTEFSAVVRKDNFLGVQFHPERSAAAGAQLLQHFLEGSEA